MMQYYCCLEGLIETMKKVKHCLGEASGTEAVDLKEGRILAVFMRAPPDLLIPS